MKPKQIPVFSQTPLAAILILGSLQSSLFAANLFVDSDGDTTTATGIVSPATSANWNSTGLIWRSGSLTGTLQAYTGSNTVTFDFSDPDSLLTAAAGTLELQEPITLTGITVNKAGFTVNGNGNTITTGLNPNYAVTNGITINATLSGTGTFSKTNSGSGNLSLGSAASLTGFTAVSVGRGSINLNASDQIPTSAALNVGSSTIAGFNLNGFNQTVASLGNASPSTSTFNSTIRNENATTPSTLTINASTAHVYRGRLGINTSAAASAGRLNITKSGSARLALVGSGNVNRTTLGSSNSNVSSRINGKYLITEGTLYVSTDATGATNSTMGNAPSAVESDNITLNGGTLRFGRLLNGFNWSNAGSAYTGTITVAIDAPDLPDSATPSMTAVAAGGVITSVTLVNAGMGYSGTPAITITGSTGGSGAVVTPNFSGPSLQANRGVTLGSSHGTLEVDSGAALTYDGRITGVGNFTKTGGGLLLLTGSTHDYAGTTSVQAGSLILSGSPPLTSPITVGDGNTANGNATLAGTGSLSAPVTLQADGEIDPGLPLTTSTLTTSANISGTGKLAMQVDDVDSDLLNLGSGATLSIAGLALDVTAFAGGANQSTYVLINSTDPINGAAFASVSLPPGYSVVYNYNDGVDTNNIAIVASGLPPFQTWATTTNGLTGGDAAPGSDPDNDGLENALEFVLGGQPNPANPGAESSGLIPTITENATAIVFTYRRTDLSLTEPGIGITVEYGTGLSGWTTAQNGVDGVTIVETNDFFGSSPGVDKVEVTIPKPPAGVASKLFARLKVVIP